MKERRNFLAKGLRELDIVMKQLFGTSVLMSFRNKIRNWKFFKAPKTEGMLFNASKQPWVENRVWHLNVSLEDIV